MWNYQSLFQPANPLINNINLLNYLQSPINPSAINRLGDYVLPYTITDQTHNPNIFNILGGQNNSNNFNLLNQANQISQMNTLYSSLSGLGNMNNMGLNFYGLANQDFFNNRANYPQSPQQTYNTFLNNMMKDELFLGYPQQMNEEIAQLRNKVGELSSNNQSMHNNMEQLKNTMNTLSGQMQQLMNMHRGLGQAKTKE